MPNQTDLLRIIETPSTASKASPATVGALPGALKSFVGHSSSSTAFTDLLSALERLPKSLPDAYPYTSSDVAANGDLVRMPVHADKFRLIYLEGMCDEDVLRKVLDEAGIGGDALWDPSSPKAPNEGNVAFYAIDFQAGDIGPYREFFLLIKLKSRTGTSQLHDMFVWRLGVTLEKAQAWGAPWHYPKKLMKSGDITLSFDRDDIAEEFEVKGKATDGTYFPHIQFTSADNKSMKAPMRWSHEALGGGFSFVNPASKDYQHGYRAPIENQGEAWIEDYDAKRHAVHIKEPATSEFYALNKVKWSMVFYGRDFDAVAKQGSPNP